MAVAIVLAATAFASGCAVACPTALLEGTLVAQGGELAVRTDQDLIVGVVWPQGVQVRREGGVLTLADWFGFRHIGGEGDHVAAGGGFIPPHDERFTACGPISVEAG